jgi:hypothetical protein
MGCGPFSAPGTVVVSVDQAPSTAPFITAPDNSPSGTYLVSWTQVAGAASYRLEEQIDAGGWQLIQDGSATSWQLSGKTPVTYGYRVRGCNTIGCGPYSSIAQVVVATSDIAPVDAPVLSAPASSESGSFNLTWSSVTGASVYSLDEQGDSGWPVIQSSPSTEHVVSGKPSGSYAYRVRGCNAAGCGPTSDIRTVTVTISTAPTSAPTLAGPPSSVDGNYSLSWTAIEHATEYRLAESTDGINREIAIDGTGYAVTNQPDGVWSYQIRACNAAGCGPASAVLSVIVSRQQPPIDAPVLSAPAEVMQDELYSVSWNAIAGAQVYELQERVGSNDWLLVYRDAAPQNPPWSRSEGSYEYQARGCNDAGCGPWSDPLTVDVKAPCPECEPVVLPPTPGTAPGEGDDQ